MPEPKGPPAKAPAKPPGKAPAGGKAAGGIKGGLTRKVGPLPVWGWAAIAGGAFVAWTFLRGGSAGAGDPGAGGALGVGMGGPSGGGGGGGGSGSGGGSGGAGGVGDAVDDVASQLPPALAPGGNSSGPVNTPSFIPGTADLETTQAYQAMNEARAALIAAADPNSSYADINRQLVERFGGDIYEGQGPEENLTVQQYSEMVLGQYPGQTPDLLTNVNAAYDRPAWYQYLLSVGPEGYVGVNSGVRDDAEYYRNLAIAKINAETAQAGLPEGSYGYPSASGSPPSITSLPIGNIVPIAAPSTAPAPVDYSSHISTLQGYIANLQTGTVTQADRDKIALYQQRIADYSSR